MTFVKALWIAASIVVTILLISWAISVAVEDGPQWVRTVFVVVASVPFLAFVIYGFFCTM